MKLFVSDLDGTLYKDGEQYSAGCNRENREAILKWIKQGNVFAVATARGLSNYEHLCDELGLRINFVGSNGAQIAFASGERMVKQLKARYFIELCQYVKENQVDATVMMQYKEGWISSGESCYPFKGSERVWRSLRMSHTPGPEEIDPYIEVSKIGIVIRPDLRDIVKEDLRKIYDKQMDIVSSDYDNIDFGPYQCSKGLGVIALAKHYHLRMSDVIVIGDSENDISMLKVTEHGYCISHAEPLVKEAAAHVVETVAEAIELELNK